MAGGGKVRIHNLFKLQGKEHNDVPDLPAGGIGAVAKVDNLRVGDTLRSGGQQHHDRPGRLSPPRRRGGDHPAVPSRRGEALHGPASDRGGGPDPPGGTPRRDR